jgi:single-strand DNA-binding protein
MNNVTLVGNMVRDAEIKTTTTQKSVATFTVAVTRKYKNADGEYQSDFISCVAWGATAEFIAKYFPKGAKIGIVGSIQTRTYEKDGAKVYVTEVNVSDAEFVERKAKDDVPFEL